MSRFRQKHLQTFIVYRWVTPSEMNAILMTGNTQFFADERSDKDVLNVKLREDQKLVYVHSAKTDSAPL